MDEAAFIKDLEEMMELDSGTLNKDLELSGIEQWDSLAFVSFLAMADSNYGVKVAPAELRACKTVGDLIKLVTQ